MCSGCGVKILYLFLYGWRRDRHTGGMGYVDGQAHRCGSIMDSTVCYGVWPLGKPPSHAYNAIPMRFDHSGNTILSDVD
jgi:hypothetical protein